MTPDYWDSYNNAARQPNALTTFVEARNRRDVGNALSTGDYGAGARAAYGAGMIDQGLELQRYGQQEADRQAQMQRQQMQDQRQQQSDARDAQDRAKADLLANLTALRTATPDFRGGRLQQLKDQLAGLGADPAALDQIAADGIDDNELDQLIAQFGGDPGALRYRDSQTAVNNRSAARPQIFTMNGRAYAYDADTGQTTEIANAPPQARPASARAPSSGRMSGGIGAGAPAAPGPGRVQMSPAEAELRRRGLL